MEKVRQTAMFTVGRAVFFGAFAISIVMLGFLFDLVLFFRSGAILALTMAVILLFYAQTADKRNPNLTETWILLDDSQRPQNVHAVKAFGRVMEEVYIFYAINAFAAAVGFLVLSFIFAFLSVRMIFSS